MAATATATRTHTEYVHEIMTFKHEIATLLTLYPHATHSLIIIDRELTSLIDIVPTPSLHSPELLCISLTHAQYTERIHCLDERLRTLVGYLRTRAPTTPVPSPVPSVASVASTIRMNDALEENLEHTTNNEFEYNISQLQDLLRHGEENDYDDY